MARKELWLDATLRLPNLICLALSKKSLSFHKQTQQGQIRIGSCLLLAIKRCNRMFEKLFHLLSSFLSAVDYVEESGHFFCKRIARLVSCTKKVDKVMQSSSQRLALVLNYVSNVVLVRSQMYHRQTKIVRQRRFFSQLVSSFIQ